MNRLELNQDKTEMTCVCGEPPDWDETALCYDCNLHLEEQVLIEKFIDSELLRFGAEDPAWVQIHFEPLLQQAVDEYEWYRDRFF